MKNLEILVSAFALLLLFTSKPVHADSGIFINGVEVPDDTAKSATVESPAGHVYQYMGTVGGTPEPPAQPVPTAVTSPQKRPPEKPAVDFTRDKVVITPGGPVGVINPRDGKFVPLPNQRPGMW